MASFQRYENKSGKFWLFKTYVGIDPRTGKKKQTTRRGFKTKKEAQAAAIKLEEEVENGLYHNGNLTFNQVYNEWWKSHKNTIKQSSQYSKKSKFDVHVIPWFGKIKLKNITKAYCQEFVNHLAKKINSVDSIKTQANLVFKYAMKHSYITVNPMQYVEIPKKEERELIDDGETTNFWTKKELGKFLSLAKEYMSEQDFMFFYTLAYTGMRKGELIALEWDDVEFDNKTIKINKTMFFHGGKEIVQTAKKLASRRTIKIDDNTLNLLKKWKVRQKEIFLSNGKTKDIKYVISRPDLRPIRLASPNEKLKKFIKSHGLKEITVHGLRHTHASILFEAGANLKEVQVRLGHKELETTMNIYTHVTKIASEKTADTFNEYMKKI